MLREKAEKEKINIPGLAGHLFQDGLLEEEIARRATQIVLQEHTTLTHYLVHSKILSSQIIFEYCQKKFACPVLNSAIEDLPKWEEMISILKAEFIQRYRVLPIKWDTRYLYLGMTDPTDQVAIATCRFHTGLVIRPLLLAEELVEKIIPSFVFNVPLEFQINTPPIPSADFILSESTTGKEDESVVKFVDQLIQNATKKGVSDIHIEPYQEGCRIRFRQLGLLHEAAFISLHLASRVLTRLKIMANLDISERRFPQDGRLKLPLKVDIRVSTCPVVHGEKMVLRLFSLDAQYYKKIDELGLTTEQKKLFLKSLALPQGLILVTGPTGSGKTSTLYAALHFLNQIEKNISTVEDPIEVELKGINQVNVNSKIGLDFPVILRAFLRQDPDIIMIGEIRDRMTAEIALQAAQTGHLVLATLHTNNAIETIIRLKSLGIESYLFAESLQLIIAQRLIRTLCSVCKKNKPEVFPFFYASSGCDHCHQGYESRTGIFELTAKSEKLSQAIIASLNGLSASTFGDMTFYETAKEKVELGITSPEEIHRIMGFQINA